MLGSKTADSSTELYWILTRARVVNLVITGHTDTVIRSIHITTFLVLLCRAWYGAGTLIDICHEKDI